MANTIYTVTATACSGNYQPWRADVRMNGKWIGCTGYCKTAYNADRLGHRFAHQHAKNNGIGNAVVRSEQVRTHAVQAATLPSRRNTMGAC